MNMNDMDTKTFRVLGKLGISLCEHFIMGTVGYRMPLRPEELAEHTAALVEGDPRGSFTEHEYRKAVQQCMQRGWLEIITPERCEAECRRRQRSTLPELFDTGFEPGVVDFTPEGFSLFRQSILGILGKRLVRYDDSGWNVDENNCRVDFLAETAGLCRKRIAEFMLEPSMYVGQSVRIISVTKPIRIGPWGPNRFMVLPQGYHATLEYEVLPEIG